MINFSTARLEANKGDWSVVYTRKLTHHLAKNEEKEFTDYHGSLYYAVAGIRQYLVTEADFEQYKTLCEVLKRSSKIFRGIFGEFTFENKKEYTVEGVAGKHYCRTEKNHGGIFLEQYCVTHNSLSISGVKLLRRHPGNHKQACEAILSMEVSNWLNANGPQSFQSTINFMIQTIKKIHGAASNAKPAIYGESDEVEDITEESEVA